jgi:hypothetical protein
VAGIEQELALEAGSLAFTVCQVPVVYKRAAQSSIKVVRQDSVEDFDGQALDVATSTEIFQRRQSLVRIEVEVVK